MRLYLQNMVVLRFFKNNRLIGAREYPTDQEAERIGRAWLKKTRLHYPDEHYFFEMLCPVDLIAGKKTLEGEQTYQRFTNIRAAVCSKTELPRMEILWRKTRFDQGLYGGEWEGDLLI